MPVNMTVEVPGARVVRLDRDSRYIYQKKVAHTTYPEADGHFVAGAPDADCVALDGVLVVVA